MFFLNLTAIEFGALLGVLGSAITALYLLERTRRKRVVSTLRFWSAGSAARQDRRRRRVQQPWSLLLQLLSLCLLLLAIAQLQVGSRERRGRDHVVLLDASAWSAQSDGLRTLLDEEKIMAERYAAAIPARDRILLVAADALATPLAPFTADRAALRNALRSARSSPSALNLEQALSFAQRARNEAGNEPGEIVYLGPAMISRSDPPPAPIRGFRFLRVASEREHVGIRGLRLQLTAAAQPAWQAAVTIQNYGSPRASVPVRVQYGAFFAHRTLSLAAGEQTSMEFSLPASAATEFIASIEAGSDLAGDHRVAIDLPALAKARIDVVTRRADTLRPLLPATPAIEVRFVAPDRYQANSRADLTVFDQSAAAGASARAVIWIDPPREQSPWPVKTAVERARLAAWHSETPLAAGLRTTQTDLGKASVFQTFDSDMVVASVSEGAVVVARGANGEHGKLAAIGFDPLDGPARFEVTTPLLFANLLRWSLPDIFQPVAIEAERMGAIAIPLDPGERADRVRVIDQQGAPLPFLATRKSIELFVERPQVLRIVSGAGQRTVPVVLPDVAQLAWTPPASAAIGLPAPLPIAPVAIDLWQVLAVLGALGWFAEWLLFGRQRKLKPHLGAAAPPARPARERELVAR